MVVTSYLTLTLSPHTICTKYPHICTQHTDPLVLVPTQWRQYLNSWRFLFYIQDEVEVGYLQVALRGSIPSISPSPPQFGCALWDEALIIMNSLGYLPSSSGHLFMTYFMDLISITKHCAWPVHRLAGPFFCLSSNRSNHGWSTHDHWNCGGNCLIRDSGLSRPCNLLWELEVRRWWYSPRSQEDQRTWKHVRALAACLVKPQPFQCEYSKWC